MLTLCLLALLATPGQVITLNAQADCVNAEGVNLKVNTVAYLVVLNPAITQTVLVTSRPTPLLAGVRVRWLDRSFPPLVGVCEGVVTNDGRILLVSGFFVNLDRIPTPPKGRRYDTKNLSPYSGE